MTAKLSTGTIWARLGADLRRFIRRRVGDDHTADDLLQETFVRIHRHVGDLAEAERVPAWAYRIARHVVADHHRRGGAAAAALPEAVAAAPVDEQAALRQALGGWLRGAVEALPPTYREAVRLAEVEGLAQQQIAARLGLSLSGAKSRVQRGRALLRQALDACCEVELDGRGEVFDCRPRPAPGGCAGCGSNRAGC